MPSSTGTVVFNDSRIKATGVIATESIGVGTTNPTSNLHVVGDASIQSNLEVGTADLFVDTETGTVGIGTTSPGFPLDVVFSGDSGIRAKSTSSHASLNLDSDSGYGYIRFQDSGTETVWLQSKPSGDLVIRPQGGNETVLFGANGNVGIGTATPTAKLDVNGISKNGNPAFYARRNSVQNTGVYVFNVEEFDTHNAYNTSNGRFTAPVAGRYVFTMYCISNGATSFWVEFRKNGTRVYNACPHTGNCGSYANVGGSIVVELAVNDYIDINAQSGSAYGGGNDHNGFLGYMIG